MLRAAIYARVSSSGQKERHTIESQLRDAPAYAKQQGWLEVGRYIDDGRSAKAGKLEKRDGFTRLIADANRGMFDVVVVVAVDRLTRSEDQTERGAILGAFQRAGVKVAVVGAGVQDMGTFAGDAYLTLQALFAAEENRKRSARTVSGKITAIGRGRKPSGWTPYGYRYSRETGVWSIDEHEASIVREIYERVIGGESCQVIAIDLTERGIKRPFAPTWLREYVQQIARRRTYMGEWRADRTRGLTIPIPPIVSEETWSQAQQALARHGKRGLRQTRHVYLLEEIALCAHCGNMIGISSAIGTRSPSKYICCRRRRPAYGQPRCELELHLTADIDRRVWGYVAESIVNPRLVARAIDLSRQHASDRSGHEQTATESRAGLARLERAEAAILARFRRGIITEASLDTELAAIAKERAILRRQEAQATRLLGASRSASEVADSVASEMERLRGILAGPLAETDRRDLVRAAVGRGGAVVEDASVTVDVHVPIGLANASACLESHRPILARERIHVDRYPRYATSA